MNTDFAVRIAPLEITEADRAIARRAIRLVPFSVRWRGSVAAEYKVMLEAARCAALGRAYGRALKGVGL